MKIIKTTQLFLFGWAPQHEMSPAIITIELVDAEDPLPTERNYRVAIAGCHQETFDNLMHAELKANEIMKKCNGWRNGDRPKTIYEQFKNEVKAE